MRFTNEACAVHERKPRFELVKWTKGQHKGSNRVLFAYCFSFNRFFSHIKQQGQVDARANLVHCPRVHLVKPAADVQMISGSTVYETCNSTCFKAPMDLLQDFVGFQGSQLLAITQ